MPKLKVTKTTREEEDLIALRKAKYDMTRAGFASKSTFTSEEDALEEFYDDRNATKQDAFYEIGDGGDEILWKKMVRGLKNLLS